MQYKDYYKILGVNESATSDEIKKAYRKLARKYHPDVSKEADAETKFKEVGEAYEVLKDPQKRDEYDQLKRMGAFGKNGSFTPPPDWESASHFSGGGFTGADAHSFSDFFESIFGQSGTAHRTYNAGHQRGFQMRGEDLHFKLALFLEEAYAGGERQIEIKVPQVDERGMVVHKPKKLKIRIPAGIGEGQHIRLAKQGAPGIGGGEPGDLFIEVEFAPHPLYTVKGKDVYLSLPVAPWEAALGTKVDVPTLAGTVKMSIPAGSTSGQKLRLKGRGLPGTHPGDQILVLQISLPSQHDKTSQELYAKLAESEKHFNPRAKLGTEKTGAHA